MTCCWQAADLDKEIYNNRLLSRHTYSSSAMETEYKNITGCIKIEIPLQVDLCTPRQTTL